MASRLFRFGPFVGEEVLTLKSILEQYQNLNDIYKDFICYRFLGPIFACCGGGKGWGSLKAVSLGASFRLFNKYYVRPEKALVGC